MAKINNKETFLVALQGKQGPQGEPGPAGAKIIKTELAGQDENGGNVYLQTFDDGSTATFTAPKGVDGTKVTKVELTSQDESGGNVYTFTFDDGSTATITAPKGPRGYQGSPGERGPTGAKIIKTEQTGQDENGGTIYTQTFDDGSTATFTVPKGAVVVKTEPYDLEEDGSVIYRQTFSDGSEAFFTAPRGRDGAQGPQGEQGPAGAKVVSVEKTSTAWDGAIQYRMSFDDGSSATFLVPVATPEGNKIYRHQFTLTFGSGAPASGAVVVVYYPSVEPFTLSTLGKYLKDLGAYSSKVDGAGEYLLKDHIYHEVKAIRPTSYNITGIAGRPEGSAATPTGYRVVGLAQSADLDVYMGQVCEFTALTYGSIMEIGEAGTSITIDDALDPESTNPIQNKVVAEALDGKLDINTTADAIQALDTVYGADINGKPVRQRVGYGGRQVQPNRIPKYFTDSAYIYGDDDTSTNQVNGVLISGTPKKRSHVSTKGYVDEKFASVGATEFAIEIMDADEENRNGYYQITIPNYTSYKFFVVSACATDACSEPTNRIFSFNMLDNFVQIFDQYFFITFDGTTAILVSDTIPDYYMTVYGGVYGIK